MPDNAWVSLSPCPYCNASVSYGLGACGLCGAALEWNVLPDSFKLKTDAGKPLEVVRVLGRGGFGVTYLADLAGVRVAVKECFPDGLVTRDSVGNVVPKPGYEAEFNNILRKFLLEARLLNQIKHPVSTKFLALWQANNTAYLMMEFIEGETLEARIAKGSRLSEFEAVALLEPILDLLEGVHTQKLLHRDIKPANIMLTKTGVELIDFGSVIKFDAQRSTKITSKILTPAYAPLELYGSQVRLGPSSDLYSLAASMYEAMTGVRVPSALDRSNGATVQPLEAMLNSVSREFSKLIARALELRIDDRFASAHEMRAALRGVPVFSKPVSSTSSVRASVTPNAPVTSSPKRFAVPRWALALVGIVGLIFAVNRLMAFNEWNLSVFDPLKSQKNLAQAWLIPVNIQDGELMRALTVVQVYQGSDSPQPTADYTAELYFNGYPFKVNKSVDYGKTEIISGCCPTPDGRFSVEITGEKWTIKDVVAQNASIHERKYPPLARLRLRLTDDRSGVIVESERKNWAKGYLLELNRGSDWFVLANEPTQQKASRANQKFVPAMTVPFQEFGEYNALRFMALNFNSDSLIHVDQPNPFDSKMKAKDLAASAIETTAITRDQLIALKRGESLEFGPNLKWAKK